MNVWTFTGNLGNDCDTRHTPNGDAVVNFSVAVRSGFGDRQTTNWARCSMFGRRGEAVAPYLRKGQLVAISGELTAREWQTQEGQTRTSLDVRVSELTLLGRNEGPAYGGSGSGGGGSQQGKPSTSDQGFGGQTNQPGGFDELDDDIPF